LFGEHSDWAAGDPPLNPAREKGCTLIVSNNQGIYAQVKQNPTHLIVRAALNDGIRDLQLNITPVSYPRRLGNRVSDMSGADLCDGDARNNID
jgi:(2Fe-2S) ferredoxin